MSLLSLLPYILIIPAVAGANELAYRDDLLKKADTERLHTDRYWRVLLLYKPAADAEMLSLVDDPRFFLSSSGKKDPKAELEATIKGFFDADKNDQEHPRCRFPARYDWLAERLMVDESRLPPVSCIQREEALPGVHPTSAALVFAAPRIGGPATMFGHTLLRVDSEQQGERVSHAVTYAPTITDTHGILYSYKSLFGYYQGRYSILPYHEKLREYTDGDRRDIWEYHLNLTEEELRRMALHIRELKYVSADYYFFDENCSVLLLYLLEAARPSLELTGAFRLWALPIETVRVVLEAGVVETIDYLPSPSARTRRLDHPRPDEGHDSSRASLALGFKEQHFFQEVRYRAVQHELSDPDSGYIEGSEIVLFGITARNSPDADGPRLERLDIIQIVSLSPRDRFFKPFSWTVKTGFAQRNMPDEGEKPAYYLNQGGGFAFKNDLLGLHYVMLEADLNIHGDYRDGYSLGFGLSAGAVRGVTDDWKMNLSASAVHYELGEQYRAYRANLQQVFRLSRDNSLNLDLSWIREFDRNQRETKLTWNAYF